MKFPELRRMFRFFSNIKRRHCMKNHDLSVFCNNCLAGCILHDFGIKFNSPTINLFIPFPDYIEFVKNIKYYVSAPIHDITTDTSYPIGWLDNESGGGHKNSFSSLQIF